jgi:hypothetical protein
MSLGWNSPSYCSGFGGSQVWNSLSSGFLFGRLRVRNFTSACFVFWRSRLRNCLEFDNSDKLLWLSSVLVGKFRYRILRCHKFFFRIPCYKLFAVFPLIKITLRIRPSFAKSVQLRMWCVHKNNVCSFSDVNYFASEFFAVIRKALGSSDKEEPNKTTEQWLVTAFRTLEVFVCENCSSSDKTAEISREYEVQICLLGCTAV